MELLTDCAQGYCEVYCDLYSSCFSEPDVCERKNEVQLYERLKDYESAALRKQGDKDTNVPIKWISVQEKLPENNDKVLAFTLSGKYAVARYDQRRQCWIAAGNLTVTHWMPLPDVPEVEV